MKQLKDNFDNPEVELVFSGGRNLSVQGISKTYYIDNFDSESIQKLDIKDIDITLFLTENSSRVFLKKDQINAVKSLKAKYSLLINYNFELFNYFSSKWLNIAYVKLFFDWDTKGYFYKQEPLYFFKDFSIFVKYSFIKLFKHLSKKQADMDLKAAKESIYYRKTILEMNSSDEYDDMDESELAHEVDRIHVREN